MPDDKISYQLSPFEKIGILRSEISDLEEEFQETETRLRAIQFEVERLRFLAGISKSYAKSKAPEGYSDLEKIEAKRVELKERIAALKAARPKVDAEAAGAPRAAPPASGAGSKPKKPSARGFQSFDDFRGKKS